jgi:hypothetical protein
LLFVGAIGGRMANTSAATAQAPKMTLSELKSLKLKAVDALFVLAFGVVAIAAVVGIALR